MSLTQGVHHIVITVKDPQKSKEFYVKAADLKIIVEDKKTVGLTDGTSSLWIKKSRDYIPKELKFDRNQIGLDHFSFTVNNLEDLKKIEQNLKSIGAEMEDGSITDDGYGTKDSAIYVKDPDGMKVEFKIKG